VPGVPESPAAGTIADMSRWAAAIGVVLLLAVPAAAAGQAPPDERAAARAFADAALRFQGSVAPLEPRYQQLSRGSLPRCVPRLLRRVPERRVRRILLLPFTNFYGELGRLFEPALTRFSMELHAVQTPDPALRSGRTAWRRMRRVFATLAAIPPVDVCAEARTLIAGGFAPTPAIRRGLRLRALMERDPLDDFDRRVERAERRLIELGIPREQAQVFEDDVDDAFESDPRR
jgi:hypothetical protein